MPCTGRHDPASAAEHTNFRLTTLVHRALLAALGFFVALSRYGEVTSWSLHPFYRVGDQLVEAKQHLASLAERA